MLPTTGDSSKWDDREKALIEAAGLTSQRGNGPKTFAPRPVVEAFLIQCQRTGLDPFARQIYCIQRAGKWQTQVSIDGARLVAERSGEYEGQTAPQWSDDGRNWFDAWIGDAPGAHPRFARVGVYRRGFREALTVVARWESYAVYQDEWKNGAKTGNQVLSAMWAKMPDLMLAKVAEMLALRKAFPHDLSGLYSTEEMQQADERTSAPTGPAVQPALDPRPEQMPKPSRDWLKLAAKCRDRATLRGVYNDAEAAGELGLPVTEDPAGPTVKQALWKLREHLPETAEADAAEPSADDDVVDAEVVDGAAAARVTDWPTVTPGEGNPEELI
jgi:phage recombination protein Bet